MPSGMESVLIFEELYGTHRNKNVGKITSDQGGPMRASTNSAWRRAWLAALMIAMLGANTVQTQSDLRKDLLLRRFSFRVEIEGIDAGFFKSVGGLSIETEVIEFREGGSDVIHK